jgi:hypothetical protein
MEACGFGSPCLPGYVPTTACRRLRESGVELEKGRSVEQEVLLERRRSIEKEGMKRRRSVEKDVLESGRCVEK